MRRSLGVMWMAVLLCLLLAGPALAGWTKVSDSGTTHYTAVWGWPGTGVNPNKVMVVGYDPGPIERMWYGYDTSWTDLSPVSPWNFRVNGVWGAASNNVWAVGDGILNYDGTGWTNKIPGPVEEIVTIPSGSPCTVQLSHGVVGTAPGHAITLAYVPNPALTLTEVTGAPAPGQFTCTDGGLLTFNSAGAGQQYRASYQTNATLNAIWGWAAGDIFAVGDQCLIYHYDGSDWSIMSPPSVLGSPVTANLYDVYGNDNEVIAVGAGGTVLRYDGAAWQVQQNTDTNDLYGVWVSNDNPAVGWAVGADETVVKYASLVWVPQACPRNKETTLSIPDSPGPYTIQLNRGVAGTAPDHKIIVKSATTTFTEVTGALAAGEFTCTDEGLLTFNSANKDTVLTINLPIPGAPYQIQLNRGVAGTAPSHDIVVKDTSDPPVTFFEVTGTTPAAGLFTCTDAGLLTFNATDKNTVLTINYRDLDDLHDVWGLGTTEFWAVGETDLIRHFRGAAWTDETKTGLTQNNGKDLHGIWGSMSTPEPNGGPEIYAVGESSTCLRYLPAAAHPGVPIIRDGGPADGATGLLAQPFLNFSSTDDDSGKVLKYTIYLDGRSKTLAGKFASGVKVHWRVPINWSLAPETWHEWTVVARCTTNGTTTTGPKWRFKTGEYPYITCISPSSAGPTYPVYIFGENFGATQGQVRLQTKVPNPSPPPATKTVFQNINVDFGEVRYWGPVASALAGGIDGTATGGSTTTLVDNGKDFVALGIKPGMAISKTVVGNEASSVIRTVAATTLTFDELTDGEDFSTGDTYNIETGGWLKPSLIPCPAPDLVMIVLPSGQSWGTPPWVLPKTYGVQVKGGATWSSPADLPIEW